MTEQTQEQHTKFDEEAKKLGQAIFRDMNKMLQQMKVCSAVIFVLESCESLLAAFRVLLN